MSTRSDVFPSSAGKCVNKAGDFFRFVIHGIGNWITFAGGQYKIKRAVFLSLLALNRFDIPQIY